MTNYTENNHLKYTIGDRLYGHRLTSVEKFKVDVGTVDPDLYSNSTYVSEMDRVATSVYNEFGKDLVLFLSGGTDSEMVARSFVNIGKSPKCAVIRFVGGYNDSDVLEAIEIAKDLNLDLEVIDFDVKDFYNSGAAADLGIQIQCTQVTYLMVYHNILKLGRPAVMGGEVLLTRNVTKTGSNWYYTFRENEDASAMRFSEKYNIPLVNEWFSYTPELLLHYLEDPDICSLIENRYNYKLTSVSSKNAILRKLYPNIRPKIKTHGFERLLGFNFEAYRSLAKDQIRRLEPSLDGIPIDIVLEKLRGTNGNCTVK